MIKLQLLKRCANIKSNGTRAWDQITEYSRKHLHPETLCNMYQSIMKVFPVLVSSTRTSYFCNNIVHHLSLDLGSKKSARGSSVVEKAGRKKLQIKYGELE